MKAVEMKVIKVAGKDGDESSAWYMWCICGNFWQTYESWLDEGFSGRDSAAVSCDSCGRQASAAPSAYPYEYEVSKSIEFVEVKRLVGCNTNQRQYTVSNPPNHQQEARQ